MKKLFTILVILLALVLLVGIVGGVPTSPIASADVSITYAGLAPLYDSGWVYATDGWQSFHHNLGEIPTLYVILAANDNGYGYPTYAREMYQYEGDGKFYGYVISDADIDYVNVWWGDGGIAYSKFAQEWWVRGEDWVRVFIYAAY